MGAARVDASQGGMVVLSMDKNPSVRCLFEQELGGGFKYVLFSPLFGEEEPILTNIFQMGWFNHQLGKVK